MKLLAMIVALAAFAGAAAEAQRPRARAMGEIIEASKPAEWRRIEADNLMVLDLASGRVVMELAPALAPNHVANIRALAREGYFDGLSINRSQDNFVVQWGDADAEDETRRRAVKTAKTSLPPEFVRTADVPFTRLPDPDNYAPQAGFAAGMPAGFDPRGRRLWGAHCYATLGVGRDNDPASGSGQELYVVIGHAPRQLDRNITVVGRVIEGMPLLATLPRGTGALGFYEKPEERAPIRRIRIMSDLPDAERIGFEALRTESASFAALTESRRNRRDAWYRQPAGHIDLCNVSLPVRRVAAGG